MNKLYADELKAESEKMRRGEAYDRRVTVSAHALLAMLERVAGLLADPDADGFDADRVEADILELLAKIKGE